MSCEDVAHTQRTEASELQKQLLPPRAALHPAGSPASANVRSCKPSTQRTVIPWVVLAHGPGAQRFLPAPRKLLRLPVNTGTEQLQNQLGSEKEGPETPSDNEKGWRSPEAASRREQF